MSDFDHPAPPPPPPWPPEPVWSPQRRSTLVRIAVIVVGILVIAAAVAVPVTLLTRGGTASPGTRNTSPQPSPSGNGTDSAALAVYHQALATADASAGFHYVAVNTGGAGSEHFVAEAGQHSGKQSITLTSNFGAEQFTLILVGGTVYFQGNVPAFEDQLGVAAGEASSLQGQWVSVVAGDGPYNVLEPGITVADQVQQLGLEPASSTTVTDSGVTAVRLSGAVPPQNGAPAGTGYLDVASTTHLPLVYVSTVSGNGVTVTSTTTFSDWGSAVTESAPATSVAWSTLGATEPPGGYGQGGGAGPTPTATPQTL